MSGRSDDLVGMWVDTPGGVGQVWAVAGCRHSEHAQTGGWVPNRNATAMRWDGTLTHPPPDRCRCKPAVWVADGRRWHLILIADLRRTPIGATA